jgi:hypothetical protein
MNKLEAKEIIAKQLKPYREKPYSELIEMIGAEPITYDFSGPSGTLYQIEIKAFWDHRPNGNIRVMGSIDDGGWKAFSPIGSNFIKNPSNEFVGE